MSAASSEIRAAAQDRREVSPPRRPRKASASKHFEDNATDAQISVRRLRFTGLARRHVRGVIGDSACVIIAGEVNVGEWPKTHTSSQAPIAFAGRIQHPHPIGRSLMLAALGSVNAPASCAASNASAICRAMDRASSRGIGPCAILSARVGPSTNSITNAFVRFDSSTPKIAAMCG